MTRSAIFAICVLLAAATCENEAADRIDTARPSYDAVHRQIVVDGNADDWRDVKAAVVAGKDHLWFGQGMTPDKWHGNRDLSYKWRAVWFADKIYFLFEVTDDKFVDPPTQPNSFLNDCIEILLDHKNRGGKRYVEDGDQKTLRGFEMHFLPSSPPLVFVDDSLSPMYPMKKPQNALFEKDWSGEVKVKKTPAGYLMEIGFSIPGVKLQKGTVMGLDTDVCDDDGNGRESLQIWTGKQVDFWITMDDYGKLRLVE